MAESPPDAASFSPSASPSPALSRPGLIATTSLQDLTVDAVHVELPSISPSPAFFATAATSHASPPPPSRSPRSSFFHTTSTATKGDIPLKILVGSWNVGNAMPPRSSDLLSKWIPQGGGGFDVVAIGLQESSYREKSSTASVVADGNVSPKTSSANKQRKNSRTSSKAMSQEDREDLPGEGDDGEDDSAECEDGGDEADDCGGEEDACDDGGEGGGGDEDAANQRTRSGDVIVKKSRTKRSIRKVSKLMRQVSTNLRESVVDALDYPFSRQLCIHLGGRYALVGKVELLEMRLLVFVLTAHTVGSTDKLTVATGLGSVIGNKGGLIFKMVVENTSLCFVSCHLAAHQDQKFLDKRNADCASILGASGIGVKHVQLDFQFDHCFWFGDLNYRVDLQYTQPQRPERDHDQHFKDVLALVKAKKWTILNANDQLRHQIQQTKALHGWELPQALFPPTFKRERHTEDQYNPQRVPSYCDRVLYKSLPGFRSNLQCGAFQCVETIATSDHKPVFAQFQVLSTPRLSSLSTTSTTTTTASASTGSIGARTESERAAPTAAVATRSMLSRTTTIEIRELAAKNLLGMDISGKSDPYVKFYSLPEHVLQRENNGSHPSTSTIMHTLAPAWQNDQVPTLSLMCDCEADARRVHIILLVMDYDATSLDDPLGNVVLSLDKFCHGSRPKFLPFEAPVVHQGKPAGTISGKLRVLLPHQKSIVDEDASGDAEVALHMAGCRCCVS